MILPAADSFCDCVKFGILENFQRVSNSLRVRAPRRRLVGGGVLLGCWLLVAVGWSWLSSHAQRINNKKKLGLLPTKGQLAIRSPKPLISRK